MSETLKWQMFLVVLIVAVAGYFAYPAEKKILGGETRKIEFGLDLQGGAEIRVGLKTEGLSPTQVKEGIKTTLEVITRRINIFGLKEPRIQLYGDNQILIQLPGQDMTEVQRVKEILLSTGKLEFKLEASPTMQELYKDRPIPPDNKEIKKYERTASGDNEFEHVLVENKVIFDGTHVVEAKPSIGKLGGWVVDLELNEWGKRQLAIVSKKYSAQANAQSSIKDVRRLAIILDNKLVSAPSLQAKILDGKCEISGGFNQESANNLAIVLKSGKLPAPLEIIGENFIGPSLGADSIARGKFSFALAALAVFLFMIIYYHGAGLIANIALAMNLTMIFGLLSFFRATLTLPGIAGLILTMGMAVDANILFYERIREEKDKGKDIKQAFETGFSRALITVLDANLTTLLAAIILYYISSSFGIDSIKGFALILSLGIMTTLFCGYFASRVMLRLCLEGGLIKKFSMFRFFRQPKFNFMKKAPAFRMLSAVGIILSIILIVSHGADSLGIDFTGGSLLQIKFKTEKDIADIRKKVQKISYPADHPNEKFRGQPRYTDIEILPVYPKISGTGQAAMTAIMEKGKKHSAEFQIRTRFVQTEEQRAQLKKELLKLFGSELPQEAIVNARSVEDPKIINRGYRFQAIVNLTEPALSSTLQSKLQENGLSQAWVVYPPGVQSKNASDQYLIYFTGTDQTKIRDTLKENLSLSQGAFPFSKRIGKTVAGKLKQGAVLALLFSWIGMIIYLALRFEFKFGIAAVIALIHDVIICLGVVIAFNWLAPDSWGITIDLSLISIAAFLTIIGYSVNDTIVVFDRIRENLKEMKREKLPNIINRSINQTLGRSIITSATSFLAVTILFFITMRSGTGIANFAFPLIIGSITGTYSTIFIAGPILNWSKSGKN